MSRSSKQKESENPPEASAPQDTEGTRIAVPARSQPGGGAMLIEQLLKEWQAERVAATDLTVAARSARAIAGEIEGYFEDTIARAEALALEKAQVVAEKERALEKALDVISRLEGQMASARDKADRQLQERDRTLAEKDRSLDTALQSISRLEAQFAAIRQRQDARVEWLEKDLQERNRLLKTREEALEKLARQLEEKTSLVERYREKFGVIMKAVG